MKLLIKIINPHSRPRGGQLFVFQSFIHISSPPLEAIGYSSIFLISNHLSSTDFYPFLFWESPPEGCHDKPSALRAPSQEDEGGGGGETVLKVKVLPVRIENSLSPLYRGTDFSTLAETFKTVWGSDEELCWRLPHDKPSALRAPFLPACGWIPPAYGRG